MPKTVLDPHITGPRISADKLVIVALLGLIPPLMWFGLGAAGIADFNSGDFATSISVLAIMEVAYAILVAYILTVATGEFEILVKSTRFFLQDFPASMTFLLRRLWTLVYRIAIICVAFLIDERVPYRDPDEATGLRKFDNPEVSEHFIHRWFAGTSPHLIFH